VRELDIHNSIVAAYNFSSMSNFEYSQSATTNSSIWEYSVVLPNGAQVVVTMYLYNTTTTVTFANAFQELLPNQLKLSAKITHWPFASIQNKFELLMVSSVGDGSGVISAIEDSQGALSSFQMVVDGVPLYGQFFPFALLDNRPYTLSTTYTPGGNSIVITSSTPVFLSELVIDPNFAVLLETSSPPQSNTNSPTNINNSVSKSVIIAVVVSVVGGVILIVAAFLFLFPRIHVWWKVRVHDADDQHNEFADMKKRQSMVGVENYNPNYTSPSKYSTDYNKNK